MKLAEKHKRFVVEGFAQFKLLHIIVDEFMGEFEDELDKIFDESYSPRNILGEKIDRRAKLSALFRRLNLTHSQFPEKYRDLFHEERERFLSHYRDTTLHIPDNILRELEALYTLTRERAFGTLDTKDISLALQILKTIAACNAANAQDDIVEITPEEAKQLSTTAKTLTRQVKQEARQLAKIADQK